jgi:hypothetical protein
MLRQRGHECWTAGSAGLARAKDDELTVWAAEHQAVVVSTDGEFSQRRMQNAIGWHIAQMLRFWRCLTSAMTHHPVGVNLAVDR